jgi:hypothetical protein
MFFTIGESIKALRRITPEGLNVGSPRCNRGNEENECIRTPEGFNNKDS